MEDNEEKPKEEKPKEEKPSTENTGDGNKPESTSLIENASAAAERLEKANAKQEELLNRQEEIMAKQTLAGRAEGGISEKPKEKLSDEDYATALLEGKVNPFEKDE